MGALKCDVCGKGGSRVRTHIIEVTEVTPKRRQMNLVRILRKELCPKDLERLIGLIRQGVSKP